MFTRGQYIEFLEKTFGEGSLVSGGRNIQFVCPLCSKVNGPDYSKKKLAISVREDALGLVHCWVCNYHSPSIEHLLKTQFHPSSLEEYKKSFPELGLLKEDDSDFEPEEDTKPTTETSLALPDGFVLLAGMLDSHKGIDWNFKQSILYLQRRGMTERDFWYFKFGATTQDTHYKNRVIVPSFDATGKLNYFTGRSIWAHSSMKYMNPVFKRETTVFNEINLDWSREITLVEGPFDLTKCNENATCLLGSELSKDHLLFQKLVEHRGGVVLALDNDAKKKTYNIAKLLSEYDVPVRIASIPEENKDVGEMSRSMVASILEEAKEVAPSDLLKFRLNLMTAK